MKKTLSTIVLLLIATIASAQDVIVKKDGSTILSKVIKVGETEVEYKKFKNQQGPTYTISTSNIQAINYENGDKDTFESPSNNQTTTASATEAYVPEPMSQEAIEKNKQAIAEFNGRTVKYIDDDIKKKADCDIYTLGVSPNSIIEDNNIKVAFEMEKVITKTNNSGNKPKGVKHKDLNGYEDGWMPLRAFYIIAKITNKTNKTIYLDLANCFSILKGEAEPYYVPSATQTTTGSSSGASVNAGAITGALGIGGALGTLAGGVNVGGGSSSATTNITYSQRVVSIPPMSTKKLDGKYIGVGAIFIGNEYVSKKIFDDSYPSEFFTLDKKNRQVPIELKRGQIINVPEEKMAYPLGMSYTYSFSENISNPQLIRIDLGIKSRMGAVKSATYGIKMDKLDTTENPLFYYFAL